MQKNDHLLMPFMKQPVDDLPLVSIALCTYNGAMFLEQQLESLVNQTYQHIEIVVVDDCSTDNTVQILQCYAKQYSYIRLFVNEENLGLSKNFEKALSLCVGEFIAISDQDDVWEKDKIAVLMDRIGDHTLIYAKSAIIDEHGISIHKTSMDHSRPCYGSDPRWITLINFIWGHTTLFKRTLLSTYFPLPPDTSYDHYLGLHALNYGSVTYIDRILVQHRRHQGNATHPSLSKVKSKRGRLNELEQWLDVILSVPDIRYHSFFQQMRNKVNHAKTKSFSLKLFLFLMRNRHVLYYASTKNFFSKVNSMRKLVLDI